MSTTHRISFASDRDLPRVEQLKEGDIAEWISWIGGDEDNTIATTAPTPACVVELSPETTPDTLPVCSALAALVDRSAALEDDDSLPCLKHLAGDDVISWVKWVACEDEIMCEWDCPKEIEPEESRPEPPAREKRSRSKPSAPEKNRALAAKREKSRSEKIELEESGVWEQYPPNKATRLALVGLMQIASHAQGIASPYMTYEQKQAAAKTLGLSIMQVTTFCNNYRKRFCKTENNKPVSFRSLVLVHATADKEAKK